MLLGGPASLFTSDILFLIPVPWAGPVLAPLLVSAAMIAGGTGHLRRDARAERVGISAPPWAEIALGAVVIVISFVLDYRNLLAGGMPHPFNWSAFSSGLLIGVGSYAWGARTAARAGQRSRAGCQSGGHRRHRPLIRPRRRQLLMRPSLCWPPGRSPCLVKRILIAGSLDAAGEFAARGSCTGAPSGKSLRLAPRGKRACDHDGVLVVRLCLETIKLAAQ
jgi:hypothetical protein